MIRCPMKTLLSLFLTFLKLGAFTFGGGYAMLAMMEELFIERKRWLTREEFLDMVALAESTPGPVAVNSATYLGYRRGGVAGAAVATFAVVLPSFVIIYVISLFLDRFLSLRLVAAAFRGVQVCVIYLIASAGLRLCRGLERSVFSITVFAVVIVGMLTCACFSLSFSSIFYILAAGMAGLTLYGVRSLRKRGGEE